MFTSSFRHITTDLQPSTSPLNYNHNHRDLITTSVRRRNYDAHHSYAHHSQLRNNVALLAGIYESLGLNELTGGFSAQKASIVERFTKSFHCGAYNKCEYNHYTDDLSPCTDSLIRMSRISEQMVWSPTCPDTRGSTVTSITSY